MKQIVFLFIFAGFVSCMGAYAQKIVYAYDASGNCTSKAYQASSGPKSSTTNDAANEANAKQNDFDVILSTDENSIKVYPNPNSGQFQVEMTGYGDVLSEGLITIFSAQGRVVLKINSLQPINSINLGNQSGGTYVLQINIDGKTFNHKMIIEK